MARGRGAQGPRFGGAERMFIGEPAPIYSPVTAPPVSVPNYSPVAGLTPEILDALNLRKEAVDATKSATDQYEADVADFKNIMAKEAEQGIASLPDVDFKKDVFTPRQRPPSGPRIENPIMNTPVASVASPPVTSPVEIFADPNLVRPINEEIDNFLNNRKRYTPKIRELIEEEMPPPAPVMPPNYDPKEHFIKKPEVFSSKLNFPLNDFIMNDMGPDNIPPIEELIGMIDIEPGDVQVPYNTEPKQSTPGNFYRGVFDSGTPVNRGRGRGPGTGGRGPYTPSPPVAPPVAPPSQPAPEMYKRPTSFESGAPTLVRAMTPKKFGTAPGFEPVYTPLPRPIAPPPKRPPRTFIDDQTPPGAKGGMYLGDSFLNKGLSQLPMNGQNDTLTTQVFQAGFRPRR